MSCQIIFFLPSFALPLVLLQFVQELFVTRLQRTEVVFRRCSVKKMFLKILHNSQENTCVGASF